MSNIAGKAYAMNVVSPIKSYLAWINKLIFWAIIQIPFLRTKLNGLITLSIVHYARWAIVKSSQFPRLDESQPKETLKYTYEFFFSNFNGSWDQYVDSFHMAIPTGLDLFWSNNIKYPKSIPLQPFYRFINYHQIWTEYYYNAYPIATATDVKSAKKLKEALLKFIDDTQGDAPDLFQKKFNRLLINLQHDLGLMETTPIVSLSAEAVEKRREQE